MIVVCKECGSDDVQSKLWYSHKRGKIQDEVAIQSEENDNWCSDCQDHVFLETKED